jgi:hypothetical protein
VFDIKAAPREGGETVPGPFVVPAASDGKAAWVQANESGQGEVHLYDLEERRDHVLATGTVVPPVMFWDSRLLWAERDSPQGGGHLEMADAETGERLTVPEPLASIRSIATLDANQDIVAWSENFRTVSAWRPGEEEESDIFLAPVGEQVDWISVAGSLVQWASLKGPLVADLRSGSIVPLTDGDGVAFTGTETLVLVRPTGPLEKRGDENHLSLNHFDVSVVDTVDLPPLPECPS